MSATNCKCVERIESQFAKNQGTTNVLMDNVDLLTMRTGSRIEWKKDGDRRTRKTFLAHNYCPFCGKKYKYGDGIPGLNLESRTRRTG